MKQNEFVDPTDPTGNLVWREDESGANILVDTMTGQTVKRVKPLFLPDGTIMKTMVLFRVESAKEFIFKKVAEIKKGEFLIAKKLPNGDIALFTNSKVPFLIRVGAKYKKDFNFTTDLKKFKTGDLRLKLQRVLDIENYEYAAQVRDELKSRNITIDV
jgi:hypothetical protein